MPRFDEVSKGIALGLGIAVLIPVAWKTLAPVLKPVARSAMKNGIRAIEKGREIVAETSEKVEDLVAETQAEMRANRTVVEDERDEAAVGAAESSGPASDQSNVRNIVNE
jgi:hypothetical protein